MSAPRVALVTGASRGIGRAIARMLAMDGYDLTISARSLESLGPASSELSEYGGRIECVAADMQHEEDISALAEAHARNFDVLDTLVLCAGIGSAGDVASFPVRRLDRQLAVNLRAPFLLIQQLLPALREAASRSRERGAKVIAIASITGVVAEPNLAAYGASKAALIALCESITVEEAGNGVTATAVSPGCVATDMTEWMRDRLDPGLMIRADDVAEIVVAISRLSRYAAVPNVVLTRPGENVWRA